MATMWVLLLVSTILVSTVQLSSAREVSNEDIKDAILSLLHMVRSTEDKLERHELRERALGEQLKKMIVNLEKKQRLLDPVKGTITRLDERLANVETILMQKDERERIQLQKTADAVEDIQTALPSFMETITEIIKEEKTSVKEIPDSKSSNSVTKEDLQKVQKELVGKAEKMSDMLSKIETQLRDVKETSKTTKNFNDKSVESVEKLEEQLKNSEQLLEKYENRLAELNNRIVPTAPISKDKPEWQTTFLQALETQRTNLEQVLSDVKTISGKINKLPDSAEIQRTKNETLGNLEKLRYETESSADKSLARVDAQLKDIQKDYSKKLEDLSKAVAEVANLTIMANDGSSYEQLRTEIRAIGKVEKVMLQTADNILDTKRRVDYGVHQILFQVEDLIKSQTKDFNSTINDRFDSIELSILESQTGALANLTTKLESEMSQVWRQIGIMYQQLSASTSVLDRLQTQTDAYVNGSMTTMDSMEGKVSQITGRMAEVDTNLNYLLGRLSLVVQDFNNIKTGLGTALNNIRNSFLEVQDKLKDAGPGPHQIPTDVQVERK